MKSLHPNLARIDLRYDETIQKFNEHQLDASQTLSILQTLVARDDNGVVWAIDPHSGKWVYRDIKGEFIPGEPPVYGVAGIKTIDLDREAKYDNDWNISNIEIDQSLIYPIGSLNGSTYLPSLEQRKKSFESGYVLAVIFLLAVIYITYKYA